MTFMRTPDIDVDKDFEFVGEISKAYVDSKTGKRYIVGVASGVDEDRDGERVSRRAIAKMARDVAGGGIKLTSSHQQDWMTEIGDAVEAHHDPKTDELVVKTELPPEGDDAIADKAWKTANTQRVGFSVGGKLLKAYYEQNELGKRRKVLDAIGLRHFMLTKNPAYADSFAEAVAKSWDPDKAPADSEFTLEVDDTVEKDSSTGSWANGDSDSGGGNQGRDSVGSGKRNAGSKSPKSKGMNTEDDGSDDDSDTDADDGKDLPKAPDERHLACPNCGHEFAADLPVDPNERQVDETNDNDDDEDEPKDTGKSLESPLMSTKLTETLDSLRGLAAADDVTKSDEEAAATAAETVEKQTTDGNDVEKMVAAAYQDHEERFGTLEKSIGEGFELIAKAHKKLVGMIEELPQGRKSVALVRPPSTGHDETVAKSVQEQVADAPDALTGLKILNQEAYGVH